MPIVLAFLLGLNQLAVVSLPVAYAQDEVVMEETTPEDTSGDQTGILETLGNFVEDTLRTMHITTYCELTLTKTDFDASATPDTDLSYRLTLKNTGTANCTGGGVKLRDYYDTRTSYVSTSVAYDIHDVDDYYLEWNFGTVEPQEEHVVDVVMHVASDVACDATLQNKIKSWSDQTSWTSYVYEYTPVLCVVNPICGDGVINQPTE